MALSISTEQTVLWDQIRYSGEPSEFAWVLPIKPGARLELASDAFFDVLDAATNPIVIPPALDCSSGSCGVASGAAMGCGDDSGGGDGGPILGGEDVDIVSHGSAGPYETVVLHSENPDALTDWLDSHDYAVPEDVEPVIEQYVSEGFDFIALRLLPSAGVQQMRPVRVIQDGGSATLPLRMVAAGSGARTAISLFVIGEGRYTSGNFREGNIDAQLLSYDYQTGLTNYTTLRDSVFEANAQQTFLAQYARQGAFFRAMTNPTTELPILYRATNPSGSFGVPTSGSYTKMADAYVQQGFYNGETSSTSCAAFFDSFEADKRRVVDPCDADGECRTVDSSSEIDVRNLACDAPIGSDITFDDLAVALLGLHPADVWVTRLDANLGRSAFGRDLELVPAANQVERSGYIEALTIQNSPCESSLMVARASARSPRDRARLGMAFGLLTVLSGVVVRRLRKLKKKDDGGSSGVSR